MNPGKFHDLVTVQTLTTTIGDNYEQTPVFADGDSFWAEVKVLGGFEILDGMVMQGQGQFRIRCEWNPIASAIKTNQRLKLENRDGLILNVTSMADDFDGRRKLIEFVCERLEYAEE